MKWFEENIQNYYISKLLFFVKTFSVGFKFSNVSFFSHFPYKRILRLYCFNHHALHIGYWMPFLGEMFTRGFRDFFWFYVISMFWQSFFKCSFAFSDVFTLREIWAVWFYTSPIVYNIFCVTAKILSNFVTKFLCLSS